MNQQELKTKIEQVMEENKIGTLATVVNDKPHTRYMTFFNDDFTLYTPTSDQTHKTDEIEKNPNVHILLGYNGEGYGDLYVEVEGTASVEESEDLKKKLWQDNFDEWFDGPNDPHYVVLKIKPSSIRLMNSKKEDPQTLEL
ncbi:pyridoxamine 5'-phosphate oxidase family protein [Priestia koreensis]|uniref:General stress protein n=1 Tax=Priestia koreensis TaxID=284581 RepID=A0A0M0KW54_9BACI|nr:pyridoxamine 5'-phosphate oxidase family protein [Priestia koreensis]KOO42857.1 general stress protein [Priestia koreensis]MCM3005390.1 pyridoxamine 5'-phosphate oxidase family protein [Priestia koreensis]